MKILLIANRVKTYNLGFQNEIEPLLEQGHEVVWAADFSDFQEDRSVIPTETLQIPIRSNPICRNNVKAYRELSRRLREGSFDVVQCGTPIGGALGRLVARKHRIPLVIYEAHGFLFFKGAPLINRTVYKWQEFLMSRWTDILVTINDEDYRAAQKMKLRKNGKLYMIHGAGVEIGHDVEADVEAIRSDLNIRMDQHLIISAGILNKNKNNHVIIKALARLNDPDIHYIICGEGPEEKTLRELADKLGVADRVHFLGFRTDVLQLMKASDIFVMPSFREGVPRSLLEAMDLGLSCIGSRTRGITELIGQDGGFLCDPKSAQDFAEAIRAAVDHPERRVAMAQKNKEEARKYSCEIVREEYASIYRENLK